MNGCYLYPFYNHQRFQKKLNTLSPYQYKTQAA
ncbi:IS3 family transposase [Bacillus paralicheniformis]